MKIGILEQVQEDNTQLAASVETSHCGATSGGRKSKAHSKQLIAGFDWSQSDLTRAQRQAVESLLVEYRELFVLPGSGVTELGRTDRVKHAIPISSSQPIKQHPRRVPQAVRVEVDRQVEEMLEGGVVRQSESPWNSPIILVKKRDGSSRFCIDYRKLNNVTVKDAYPLPRIDETLDALGGARFFSTLDLASGYWQVEVTEEDKPKTAFTTGKGHYEFNVMPFGLSNAPATFQRLMDLVLTGLQYEECLVYLDDVIIFSSTFEEHMSRLRSVFSRLVAAGLKLKLSKCHLLCGRVKYLGHVVSQSGLQPYMLKVSAVREYPVDVTQLRSFMGLAGYYRRFVEGFSQVTSPLFKLLEKGVDFIFSEDCQKAFEELKYRLTTAPVLAFPRFDEQFRVATDASNVGIGAVLFQHHGGREHVIAYASRSLHKPEKNYSATEKRL